MLHIYARKEVEFGVLTRKFRATKGYVSTIISRLEAEQFVAKTNTVPMKISVAPAGEEKVEAFLDSVKHLLTAEDTQSHQSQGKSPKGPNSSESTKIPKSPEKPKKSRQVPAEATEEPLETPIPDPQIPKHSSKTVPAVENRKKSTAEPVEPVGPVEPIVKTVTKTKIVYKTPKLLSTKKVLNKIVELLAPQIDDILSEISDYVDAATLNGLREDIVSDAADLLTVVFSKISLVPKTPEASTTS